MNNNPTNKQAESSGFNIANLAAYAHGRSPQAGRKYAIEVHQDEGFTRLTAENNNAYALTTQGIASCIGICLLNLDYRTISLSHISSIFNDFDSELEEELEFSGPGCKVVLITNPRCADDDSGISIKEQQDCRRFQMETIESIKKLLFLKVPDINIEEKHTLTGNFFMTVDGVVEDIVDTAYRNQHKI